jgi:hypothetical protein
MCTSPKYFSPFRVPNWKCSRISNLIHAYFTRKVCKCVPLRSAFVFGFYVNLMQIYELCRCSDRLRAGRSGFNSRQGKVLSLLHNIQAGSRANQPHIQWVPWTVSHGVNQRKRKADHSPPSSVEVKNSGAIPPLPHMYS